MTNNVVLRVCFVAVPYLCVSLLEGAKRTLVIAHYNYIRSCVLSEGRGDTPAPRNAGQYISRYGKHLD